MQYQVDYYSVLKSIILPLDIRFLFLFIGLPVGGIAIFLFLGRKKFGRNQYLQVITVFIILLTLLMLIPTRQYAGSGWVLKNNYLIIKSPPVLSTIDLATATISLEDSNSPWQPVYRKNGFAVSGLATGWYRLRNGKDAVVFRHIESLKMVVVITKDCIYVIQHPGVEDLYNLLIHAKRK